MKAFVVGGDLSVMRMLNMADIGIAEGLGVGDQVDFICLTGGADVDPRLYGEKNISSSIDPGRDVREAKVFETYLDMPKVGICRGGQFLNVMSGGKMIQDIPGHHMGYHPIFDHFAKKVIKVHGDHHQAMVPHNSLATIIATSKDDINEVVYYQHTSSLCFQGHPEWGHEETREYFFELLDRIFAIS
jgi:putative glutamine amidotransferase